MVVTAILLHVVATERWKWPRPVVWGMTTIFLIVDFAFLGANLIKIADGGWLPLLIGAVTAGADDDLEDRPSHRRRPSDRTGAAARRTSSPKSRASRRCACPGTAVFMTAQPTGTPPALAHNVHYNKVLHEHVVVLTARTEPTPFVSEQSRVSAETLGQGLYYVTVLYGFMEDPNIPEALAAASRRGVPIDADDVTYFLGRETLIVTSDRGMAEWREKLFVVMARNAVRATAFFRLPPERVVELGVQVEM